MNHQLIELLREIRRHNSSGLTKDVQGRIDAALHAENERLRDDYSEACDDAMAVARKLRAAEAECERLRASTTVQEAVACVFDWLKSSACNTDDEERSILLDELAEDVIEFAPDYRRQWKDIVSMSATIKRLEKELAALKAVQPVASEREAFDLWLPDFGEGSEDVAARRGWEAGVEWVRAALSAPAAAYGRVPTAYVIKGLGTVTLQYKERPAWADGDPTLTVTPLCEATGQDVSALVDALEKCAACGSTSAEFRAMLDALIAPYKAGG